MFPRLAAAVMLVLIATTVARAETRVALVIGNGDYAEVKPRLPNPANDAAAIGTALVALGFDVEVVADATKDMMEDATARLARKARSADVTLLFYAGHGIQDLGQNYLAPIDASLSDETDLRRRFVRLDDVLDDLSGASGAVILILDACRDNLAVEALREAVPKTRSAGVSRGLAPVPKTNGLLVAFATQPTRVADDGDREHSPFTEALLAHIADDGAEFRTVLTRVRVAVAKATDNRQIPETSDSLLGEIYLRPASLTPEVKVVPAEPVEPPPVESSRVEPTVEPSPVKPDPTIPPPSVSAPAVPGTGLLPGCTRRPCGEALRFASPIANAPAAPREPVAAEPAPISRGDSGASGIPGCSRRPCPQAY